MTIQQALKVSDLNQTEAEILLSEILQVDRAALFAHPEQDLSETQEKKFRELVARRQKNEPLAYLLGHKEFFGLDFVVNKSVLIPRPETENLVEAVIKESQSCPSHRSESLSLTGVGTGFKPVPTAKTERPTSSGTTILDIGTGSGCIAISLAKNLPKAQILATDVSPEALEVARLNARRHGVENKITFLQSNLLDDISTSIKPHSVDLIAANLPYVKASVYPTLEPQLFHEPKLALVAGPTGLELYEKLFEQAKQYLKPTGKIIYEVDGKILIR